MERTCQWTVEANGGNPRAGRKPFLPRKPLVRAARASQTLRPITSTFASISSEERAAEQHASAPNGAQTFRFGNGNEGGLNLCDRYWCPRSAADLPVASRNPPSGRHRKESGP